MAAQVVYANDEERVLFDGTNIFIEVAKGQDRGGAPVWRDAPRTKELEILTRAFVANHKKKIAAPPQSPGDRARELAEEIEESRYLREARAARH